MRTKYPVYEYLFFCDVFENENGLLLKGSEPVVMSWIKSLEQITLCNHYYLYRLSGFDKVLIKTWRRLNDGRF